MQIQPRTDKAAFRAKVLREEPVTAQEVFDVAVEGVILQGAPSIAQGGTKAGDCVYRTPEGLECAAGQVWPDELYNEVMEGQSINGLADANDVPESLRSHLTLLKDLQQAHDCAAATGLGERKLFLEGFGNNARHIAEKFRLTVPPLAEDPHGASVDAR